MRVESTATFYHLLHATSHGTYEILFSDNIVDRIGDAIAKELGERTLGQLVDAHLDKEQVH